MAVDIYFEGQCLTEGADVIMTAESIRITEGMGFVVVIKGV